MLGDEQLSALLASLYSAPLQNESWRSFLNELGAAVDAHTCGLLWVDHQARTSGNVSFTGGSVPQQIWEKYNSEQGANDPFAEPFRRKPRLQIVHGDELIPYDRLVRTEFHANILEPGRCRHLVVLPILSTQKRLEVISVWRNPDQGILTPESLRLLELIIPHVRTALELRKSLQKAELRAARVEAVLDRLEMPAFLLNSNGRAVCANASAMALVENGAVALRRKRLWVAQSQQAHFDSLIRAAVQSAAAGSVREAATAMPLHRSGATPLHVWIAPIRVPGLAEDEPAHVLVVITDPTQSSDHSSAVLRALYGLSVAESEVSLMLKAGRTLEEISETRGVAVETSRAQLKSVLHKTGKRRQTELVALLSRTPPL